MATCPTATGLHAAGWHEVLSEAFTVKPLFLRARDGEGSISGVLPLFRSRSLFFGDFISSLEDGHCAGDTDTARALARGALDLLTQEACGCLIYKRNFTGEACITDCRQVETVRTVVSTSRPVDSPFRLSRTRTRAGKCERRAAKAIGSVRQLSVW